MGSAGFGFRSSKIGGGRVRSSSSNERSLCRSLVGSN